MWSSPTSEAIRFTLTILNTYAPKILTPYPTPNYQEDHKISSPPSPSLFTYPTCTQCSLPLPASAAHTYLTCPANADIYNDMDIKISHDLSHHPRSSKTNPLQRLTSLILDTFPAGPDSYPVHLTDINHPSLPPAMRSHPRYIPTHDFHHLIHDLLMSHPRLFGGEPYAINYPRPNHPTLGSPPNPTLPPLSTPILTFSHIPSEHLTSSIPYTPSTHLPKLDDLSSSSYTSYTVHDNLSSHISSKETTLTQTTLSSGAFPKKRKRPYKANTSTTDRPASQIATLLQTIYQTSHSTHAANWSTCNPLFTISFQHLHTIYCPNTDYINSPPFIRNILMENFHDTLDHTTDILMITPLKWGAHTWLNPTPTIDLLSLLSQMPTQCSMACSIAPQKIGNPLHHPP